MSYRTIGPAFWRDPRVKALSLEGRAVAVWLWVGPSCSVVPGLVAVSREVLALEVGLQPKALDKALVELERSGLLDSDPAGLFFLRGLASWCQGFNPSAVLGWGAVFRDLPPLPLLARVRSYLAGFCCTPATRSALSKAIPETQSNSEDIDTVSTGSQQAVDRLVLRSRSDPDPIRSDPGECERADPPASPAKESKPKGKSRCPETFEPGETAVRLAEELGLSGRLGRIRDGFVDYWLAEGRTKADWQRTFQVWLRREADRSGVSQPPVDVLAERRRAEYQAKRKAATEAMEHAVPPPPDFAENLRKLFK